MDTIVLALSVAFLSGLMAVGVYTRKSYRAAVVFMSIATAALLIAAGAFAAYVAL